MSLCRARQALAAQNSPFARSPKLARSPQKAADAASCKAAPSVAEMHDGSAIIEDTAIAPLHGPDADAVIDRAMAGHKYVCCLACPSMLLGGRGAAPGPLSSVPIHLLQGAL